MKFKGINNEKALMTLNLIKKARKNKNLTLKKLAEMVGATDSYISLIEQGKRNISFEFADKLCKALDLQIETLDCIIGKNQLKLAIEELNFLKSEKNDVSKEIKRIRYLLYPISDENEEMIEKALIELEKRLSD